MQKFINYIDRHFIRKDFTIILVVIISVFTFWQMFRPGMYSTQDFHIFRMVEFDKCFKSNKIPCRWAPDAGLGYGEPVFNFYGQLSYVFGEVFYLISGSFIDSIKFLFIFSLALSAVSMYFLSKKIWSNKLSAFLSSIVYIYAPYRAVDVWVRGALPEAMSFVLFPLIILSIEERSVLWLSITTSMLILNHNLSFVMIAPLIVVWIVYKKFWKGLLGIMVSFFVSAFYIIPVIFESKFINLISTTQGHFDFHNHFVELRQLLISNYWGYGASVWGNGDGLSLSIGYLQWILPLIILITLIIKKNIRVHKTFLILLVSGWVFLFLTHNKSTLIWESILFMKYIQFPWRFFSISLFCFSLSSGLLVSLFNKKIAVGILVLLTATLIIVNYNFFRPDIWYPVKDSYYLTGEEWNRQRTASIGDFWPDFGHKIPTTPSDGTQINYFPGWKSTSLPVGGLIPSKGAVFTDTLSRKVGNMFSLVTLLGLLIVSASKFKWKKEH